MEFNIVFPLGSSFTCLFDGFCLVSYFTDGLEAKWDNFFTVELF